MEIDNSRAGRVGWPHPTRDCDSDLVADNGAGGNGGFPDKEFWQLALSPGWKGGRGGGGYGYAGKGVSGPAPRNLHGGRSRIEAITVPSRARA